MIIKNLTAFSFILALFFSACQNGSGTGESVQEIRQPVPGGNAEVVRNPISAGQSLDTNLMARIVFEQPEFEFGEVKEGEEVNHAYKFKNTGAVPLLISNARASCGCTVPTWPKDPIPPGGSGEILAKFNTTDRTESQKKTITVTSNSWPQETQLVLHGFVKPK